MKKLLVVWIVLLASGCTSHPVNSFSDCGNNTITASYSVNLSGETQNIRCHTFGE